MMLIVIPPKRIDLLLGVVHGRDPMHVQAFLRLAGAVAMIGRVVRLHGAGRVAEVMRQLPVQCALDHGLLKTADRDLQLLRRQWPWPTKWSRISDGTGSKADPFGRLRCLPA